MNHFKNRVMSYHNIKQDKVNQSSGSKLDYFPRLNAPEELVAAAAVRNKIVRPRSQLAARDFDS